MHRFVTDLSGKQVGTYLPLKVLSTVRTFAMALHFLEVIRV